jgi:hypothetical protein
MRNCLRTAGKRFCLHPLRNLPIKVRYYLPRDEKRLRIAGAGRAVIRAGRHSYGDRLMQITNAESPLLVRHRMAGSEPITRAMVR